MYIVPHIPINSLNDLIKCLYTAKDTLERQWYANYTYLDKEFTQVECYGQRRSFEDLLTLANTYFPGTTEIQLMCVLKDLQLMMSYCEDICKIVFFTQGGYSLRKENFDEFINWDEHYVDGTYEPPKLLEIWEQTL